jgi:hypothetical protein
MKRKYLIAAGGLAVLLAGGLGAGVAVAAIPDGGGVIHACYKTPVPAHGTPLQVIDSGAGGSCASGTLPLTWNQTGPQGPAGATGDTGPQGAPGASGYQVVYQPATIPHGDAGQAEAECPSGEVAVGGGFVLGSPPFEQNIHVRSSRDYTRGDISGWQVVADNTNSVDYSIAAVAYCLALS